MATVLSLEPESTTTSSSAQATLSRQARRRSASLRATMATESLGIREAAGRLDPLDPGRFFTEPLGERGLGRPAQAPGRAVDVAVGMAHLAGRLAAGGQRRRPPRHTLQLPD